jgi:uncharacterized protein (DUF427 family)
MENEPRNGGEMTDQPQAARANQPQSYPESAMDFPDQPSVQDFFNQVQVVFHEIVIADSRQCVRIVQKGHAPIYYVPPADVIMSCLKPMKRGSEQLLEGEARYYKVTVGEKTAEKAAWSYPDPRTPYERIKAYIAFDVRLMDACLVDGEKVIPAAGADEQGWVTKGLSGLTEHEAIEPDEEA